jgi:hypothetical protein
MRKECQCKEMFRVRREIKIHSTVSRCRLAIAVLLRRWVWGGGVMVDSARDVDGWVGGRWG